MINVANNSKLVMELTLKLVALYRILGGKFKNLGFFSMCGSSEVKSRMVYFHVGMDRDVHNS